MSCAVVSSKNWTKRSVFLRTFYLFYFHSHACRPCGDPLISKIPAPCSFALADRTATSHGAGASEGARKDQAARNQGWPGDADREPAVPGGGGTARGIARAMGEGNGGCTLWTLGLKECWTLPCFILILDSAMFHSNTAMLVAIYLSISLSLLSFLSFSSVSCSTDIIAHQAGAMLCPVSSHGRRAPCIPSQSDVADHECHFVCMCLRRRGMHQAGQCPCCLIFIKYQISKF